MKGSGRSGERKWTCGVKEVRTAGRENEKEGCRGKEQGEGEKTRGGGGERVTEESREREKERWRG